MAQLFETLCMMLAFKESHSLAMHYCRLVWDVRSLSMRTYSTQISIPLYVMMKNIISMVIKINWLYFTQTMHVPIWD